MKKFLKPLLFTLLFLGSDYLITGSFSPFLFGLLFALFLFLGRFSLLLLATLSLLHQLFFSYFQREIEAADIYNFFTHIQETFESLSSLIMIVYKPLIFFVILVIMIIWLKPKPILPRVLHTIPIILFLLFMNQYSALGLKLLPALYDYTTLHTKPIQRHETPLYPKRKPNTNIVLIIGESMKYNAFVEQNLKKLGHFHKKILAGATNTDVSVPLLINNKTTPLALSHTNETNLFKLAQKNDFQTTFISIQCKRSLQYIKPYLQTEHINHYKSYTPEERKEKFDFLLLEDLKHIDLHSPQFVVLQQIGEHSPYLYFKGEKSTPKENYHNALVYSFDFYEQVYRYLLSTKESFIMIVTSDHGEFTGEDGRWGHNAFEKTIYEVPLFIASNTPLPEGYHDIRSHHHLSQYITYLLGYHDSFVPSSAKSIVNGTMITGEDGYRVIERLE